MNKIVLLFLLLLISTTARVAAQGSDCSTATPFCTGVPVSFSNNTNVPDLGTLGCLGTSPNPAWYYMQIANPGSLTLNISQVTNSGVGIDVDFICWGPFSTMAAACAINFATQPSVDCSYSASPTETCTIPNALAGQFYLLLLTNFSNQQGTISFKDSSNSTATTNCGIVCNAPIAMAGPVLHMDCTQSPVVLQAISFTPGVTYHWTGPGGFNSTFQFPSASLPGNYTVIITDTANPNCPATAHQLIDLSNMGAPNVSTGPTVNLTCVVSNVALTSNSTTANVSYAWTGPGGFTSTVQSPSGVSTVGTYSVKVTDPANGCYSIATQIVSTNTIPPNGSVGANQFLTCTVPSVNLSASSSTAGVSYSWAGPGGFTSAVQNPTGANQSGAYQVTITNPLNGCTKTLTQNVAVNTNPPSVNTGPTQTLTCSNPQTVLAASSGVSGVTYSWSGPGGFTSNVASPGGISTVGSYSVTVTNPANGCTASTTQSVLANFTPPNLTHCTNQTITCAAPTVILSANSLTTGATFHWSGPNSFASPLPVVTGVSVPGLYHVNVNDPQNGCNSNADVLVFIDTISPNVSTGSTQTITCATTSVNLSSSSTTANVQFGWSGPNGFSSAISNPVNVNNAGNYSVLVTNSTNGCTSGAVQQVLANTTLPNVVAGSSQTITCAVNAVGLSAQSATSGVSYAWSGPSGYISSIQNPVGVSSAGNYTVTVVDPSNGCSATAVQQVLQNTTTPAITMGASQTLNCIVRSVNLSASSVVPNTSCSWTGPNGYVSTLNAPIGISFPGTYTATITDPVNGCSSSAGQIVLQNIAVPNVVVGSTLNLTCIAPAVKLNCTSSTPNASYFWTDSSTFNSSQFSPLVSAIGNYYVTVTNPVNGCKASAMQRVNSLIAIPVVDFTPSVLSGCQPLSVQFNDYSTVSSGNIINWIWSFGNGDSAFVQNPDHLYTGYGDFSIGLKVITDIGCVKDTVVHDLISVFRKPIADFTYVPDFPDVFLPVVNFRDRTAGIPSSWQWDFGDLHHAIDQDPTHTYLKPGKYPVSLFVETAEGCKDSAYREIIIKDNYALYAPTAFTPNNDGENDVFTAVGTGITKFKMILFDRWGKLYFTSDDLSKGWDGTINGTSAPEGVYTYRINYTDLFGGKHEYLNAITLVR